MPQAGLDNATMRNIEIGESAFKEIKQDAEKLSGDIETFWQRDFKAPTNTIHLFPPPESTKLVII